MSIEYKQENVSVKLPHEQVEQLKAEAKDRNVSLSVIVKERINGNTAVKPIENLPYTVNLLDLEDVNLGAVLELIDNVPNITNTLDLITALLDAVRAKGGQVQEQYIEKAKQLQNK